MGHLTVTCRPPVTHEQGMRDAMPQVSWIRRRGDIVLRIADCPSAYSCQVRNAQDPAWCPTGRRGTYSGPGETGGAWLSHLQPPAEPPALPPMANNRGRIDGRITGRASATAKNHPRCAVCHSHDPPGTDSPTDRPRAYGRWRRQSRDPAGSAPGAGSRGAWGAVSPIAVEQQCRVMPLRQTRRQAP